METATNGHRSKVTPAEVMAALQDHLGPLDDEQAGLVLKLLERTDRPKILNAVAELNDIWEQTPPKYRDIAVLGVKASMDVAAVRTQKARKVKR